jgi:DNA-binding transcriptional ArsR family regulator
VSIEPPEQNSSSDYEETTFSDAEDRPSNPSAENRMQMHALNPSLPELARAVLAGSRRRQEFLSAELFGEPAWDMLLDLFAAHHEGKQISVSSACIASGGSATTALRWIARLEAMNYVSRIGDGNDRRRIYVRLTPLAEQAIAGWLRSCNFSTVN